MEEFVVGREFLKWAIALYVSSCLMTVKQFIMPFLIEILRSKKNMRVKYFPDTDTTLLELSTKTPVEAQELNENIYLDLDEQGRVVSMTIEHASQSTNVEEFLYQRISTHSPA